MLVHILNTFAFFYCIFYLFNFNLQLTLVLNVMKNMQRAYSMSAYAIKATRDQEKNVNVSNLEPLKHISQKIAHLIPPAES